MAGRGPSPKAIAERRAGSSASPAMVWAAPDAPAGLSDAGTTLYEAIVDDVADGFELDARELAVLERACRLADLAAELEASITEQGLWVTGSTGQPVLNKAVTELRQCQSAVATLLGRVELGPVTRTGHLNSRQRNKLRDVVAGG